jgi:hypothetical protein
MAVYNKLSPYYLTEQKNGNLDIITWRDIPPQANDILFTITPLYMHRPDLLAYDLYQNSNLWWVFAVRNPDVLIDPTYDFVPGQQIYIPQLPFLKSTLGF